MASPPVSYATYQGHRRGQSSTSATVAGQDHRQEQELRQEQPNRGRNGTVQRSLPALPPSSSTPTSLESPMISISQAPRQQRSTVMLGERAAGTNGTAPPPLRSISSLRSARAAGLLPPGSSGKGKEASRTSSTLASAASTLPSVSVQGTVPSAKVNVPGAVFPLLSAEPSDGSAAPPSPRHSKRHSYSALNSASQGWQSQHTRSASSSTMVPGIPQHISTAQRLRSAPQNGSSNSSSPTSTPRGMSPSLEMMGGSSSVHDLAGISIPAPSDAIGRRTAYRAGFQPKGTYRVRTDEFSAARERKKGVQSGPGPSRGAADQAGESRGELRSQRLLRRLEKLLAVHYESTPISLESMPAWLPNTIRRTRQLAEEDKRIRDEEMRIVKWEEDATRKACPICGTSFSLSIRKHHCRLCGRIVCASPYLSQPAAGVLRNESSGLDSSANLDAERKCSSIIVSAGKTGAIVKDQVVREDRPGMMEGLEEGRRGIRICKECREVIMHRQYMLDDGHIPAYLALYEALISLQREIEQSLPDFQEMVLGLQKQDSAAALGTVSEVSEDILSPHRHQQDASTAASSLAAAKLKNRNSLALQRDAAQARKQLLANFANYDTIAKKIRNLDDEGNASLARIKTAIWTKANLFLQQNMFPLQSLPKLTVKREKKQSTLSASGANTPTSGNTSDASDSRRLPRDTATASAEASSSSRPPGVADAKADARALELVQTDPQGAKESLNVLEEQLRLVLAYAESASKARKFQDATSLRNSAQDLEIEIQRLRRLGV